MLEYVLMLQICAGAQCEWARAGTYTTENACVMAGLAAVNPALQLRCVQLEKGRGRAEHVPLPRARPLGPPR
jgi:hypothetical protein